MESGKITHKSVVSQIGKRLIKLKKYEKTLIQKHKKIFIIFKTFF